MSNDPAHMLLMFNSVFNEWAEKQGSRRISEKKIVRDRESEIEIRHIAYYTQHPLACFRHGLKPMKISEILIPLVRLVQCSLEVQTGKFSLLFSLSFFRVYCRSYLILSFPATTEVCRFLPSPSSGVKAECSLRGYWSTRSLAKSWIF